MWWRRCRNLFLCCCELSSWADCEVTTSSWWESIRPSSGSTVSDQIRQMLSLQDVTSMFATAPLHSTYRSLHHSVPAHTYNEIKEKLPQSVGSSMRGSSSPRLRPLSRTGGVTAKSVTHGQCDARTGKLSKQAPIDKFIPVVIFTKAQQDCIRFWIQGQKRSGKFFFWGPRPTTRTLRPRSRPSQSVPKASKAAFSMAPSLHFG